MFDDGLPDLATIEQLAEGLTTGRFTSVGLLDAYRRRIERLDGVFGSIRGLVPGCLDEAAASDEIRSGDGPRGPLEGIPVILKDNIDVAGMPTTGGALALEHSVPARDAPLVQRLRAAGAVIMAKANLSELANFLTENMPSGYSSLGGQVLNPYDLAFTPSGSSSGSAVAVALGLAPVAVGTETDGSIISPAECQSLVGMKPTLGLVSRTGILPIAPSQDTAGPMTGTVADALVLLAAMAGRDPEDPATGPADRTASGLRALELDTRALQGVAVGVLRTAGEGKGRDDRQQCHDAVLGALERAGAVLSDVEVADVSQDDELQVLTFEFAPAVDRYLASVGGGASVASLAELRDWNAAHPEATLKFGQTHVDQAVAVDHQAAQAEYLETRRRDRSAAEGALEEALGDRHVVLVIPGMERNTLAARAGWPSVVVPAGYAASNRRPVGVTLIGRPWTDARLLVLAHALERAHPVRRAPWELNPAAFRRLTG